MIDNRLQSLIKQLTRLSSTFDNMRCSRNFIRDLPKADIHVHLPGTISPTTAWELGVRNGLIKWEKTQWEAKPLADKNPHRYYSEIFQNFEGIRYDQDPDASSLKYAIINRDFSGFDRIMATVQGHRYPPGGIQNESDLWLVLQKYLEQCKHDNIIYTEVQQNIRMAYALYPHLEQQEARLRLYDVLFRASEFFLSQGVVLKFLNCFNKTGASNLQKTTQQRSKDATLWLNEASRHFPNLFVGLQSAGSENCPEAAPENLISGYHLAYENGFGCEAHAGEGTGFLYLNRTLKNLPVQRIAHGFQAIEHLPTICEILEKDVTLVMAPIINLILGASVHQYSGESKISKTMIDRVDDHPFFSLFRQHKIRIALSSDNPQMGGLSLANTMLLLAGFPIDENIFIPVEPANAAPITVRELIQLNTEAIVSAFIDIETKVELLGRILQYLLAFQDTGVGMFSKENLSKQVLFSQSSSSL
ncbi:adenosine deaminase [Chlamydia vaughanii]|uniref:adenosine deaminase n=1 Tax=Chlamydia vaughanii TaxID=3112552 RepID=UPI0032B216E3